MKNISHNKKEQFFVQNLEGSSAYLFYQTTPEHLVIYEIEIPAFLADFGIEDDLIQAVIKSALQQGKRVLPLSKIAVNFFRRKPEFKEALPVYLQGLSNIKRPR